MADEPRTTLSDRTQVYPGHREINPKTGMQAGYVVLAEEEVAKGYVRPFRKSYIHVGPPGYTNLRPLTAEEKERYDKFGYVGFEKYNHPGSSVTGRFWTAEGVARIGKGCGGVTTMGDTIAATYARDPQFYGSTFCCHCRAHFPVGESGEFVWDGTSQRVGT